MTQDHDKWRWQEPGGAWKGAGLYHITLKIPSCEPLLGELIIPDNDPTKGYVKATPFGRTLINLLWDLPKYQPDIKVLHYALMPDHVHTIWYVQHTLKTSIRAAVWGFWKGAQRLGRAYSYKDSSFDPTNSRHNYQESLREQLGYERYYALSPIFTEQLFIRPMGQRRQLPTTIRYIDLNPQRLATMRVMPGFFRVQDNIEIAGRIYSSVGNADLLDEQQYMPVHVRRTMIEEAEHGYDKRLCEYMDSCITAAKKGAVMVSPFIHEKEREVLRSVLANGGKVIYLADNGFGDFYKPSDGLFDAVANKQVLILSPWSYDPKKRHITRAECVALNQMAEEICSFLTR